MPADPAAPPAAVEALGRADQVVLGPGSLFTSVLAAVAVPGIRPMPSGVPGPPSTSATSAPKVPETAGFDVAIHVAALAAHGVEVDVAVYDPAGWPSAAPRPGRRSLAGRPNGLAHDPAKLASALSVCSDEPTRAIVDYF